MQRRSSLCTGCQEQVCLKSREVSPVLEEAVNHAEVVFGVVSPSRNGPPPKATDCQPDYYSGTSMQDEGLDAVSFTSHQSLNS